MTNYEKAITKAKMYRIYYNWYHENAAIGFECDTKIYEADTIGKLIEILTVIEESQGKYELLNVEKI